MPAPFFVGLEEEMKDIRMDTSPKVALHTLCSQLVEQRIATAKEAMDAAQAAANTEGKSSVGDKYETTRAMMQLERDQNARLLGEAIKLKQALENLDPTLQHEQVRPGSIVRTSAGNYYVSISLGSIALDGVEYIALSPVTPLGSSLLGLKPRSKLEFNKRKIEIIDVL